MTCLGPGGTVVDIADVAAELGISKSAFLERLHRAERTLFRQLFA